nr:hypothetical protein StreXyl84_25310 [Streptomyces sp. Xyl84]
MRARISAPPARARGPGPSPAARETSRPRGAGGPGRPKTVGFSGRPPGNPRKGRLVPIGVGISRPSPQGLFLGSHRVNPSPVRSRRKPPPQARRGPARGTRCQRRRHHVTGITAQV